MKVSAAYQQGALVARAKEAKVEIDKVVQSEQEIDVEFDKLVAGDEQVTRWK